MSLQPVALVDIHSMVDDVIQPLEKAGYIIVPCHNDANPIRLVPNDRASVRDEFALGIFQALLIRQGDALAGKAFDDFMGSAITIADQFMKKLER